jgi:hypothetical protein
MQNSCFHGGYLSKGAANYRLIRNNRKAINKQQLWQEEARQRVQFLRKAFNSYVIQKFANYWTTHVKEWRHNSAILDLGTRWR